MRKMMKRMRMKPKLMVKRNQALRIGELNHEVKSRSKNWQEELSEMDVVRRDSI